MAPQALCSINKCVGATCKYPPRPWRGECVLKMLARDAIPRAALPQFGYDVFLGFGEDAEGRSLVHTHTHTQASR